MISKILKAVTVATSVSETLIRSACRTSEVVEARGIFFHVCDILEIKPKYSAVFLGKDRGTAVYFIDKHRFAYLNNIELRDKTNKVLNSLFYKKEEPKESEVTFKPIFNEEFKIINASSRYFGKCFVGMVGKEIVTYGSRVKVINAMLDYNTNRNGKIII